jgi:hypothetical protein
VWMEKVESEVLKDENCKNFRHLHINGGCHWKKEQKMIETYIKIVGWTNGNAIWQIQNSALTFHPFYFHFLLEAMS